MPQKEKQLKLTGTSGHGGARSGAGRPRKKNAIVHAKRPRFNRTTPLHVTVRVRKDVPSLRSKVLFKEFKMAARLARESGFRMIHFSLLSNHLHFLIEADNQKELETVMKSFLISFSKRIRSALNLRFTTNAKFRSQTQLENLKNKRPSIFDQRYHLSVLKNPTQTRNALRYVLLNEEKHRGFKFHEIRSLRLSQFQSCFLFCDWKSLVGIQFKAAQVSHSTRSPWHQRHRDMQMLLHPPESWLFREGWKRAVA